MSTASERAGVGPWFVRVGALWLTAPMAVYLAARVSAEERLRRAHEALANANQSLAGKTRELEASLAEQGAARGQRLHDRW